MLYGMWLSADGLLAQQYRQDVIANNLANVETAGFKPDRVAFIERLNESLVRGGTSTRHSVLDASTGGVFEAPVYTDYAQGPILPTEDKFDLAILGDGFLAIGTDAGPQFTRDGRLMMSPEGTLRHDATGAPVLDVDRRPIVLDPASRGELRIDESGNVRQGDAIVARLALVDFADRQKLVKVGENLFDASNATPMVAAGRLRQGAVEASGVDAARTLVEMIAASRAYQLNASLISLQDESLGRLVNDVGRIG